MMHKKTEKYNVLLLQGPVGPFFLDLQKALEGHGYSAHRIVFNAGDRLFSKKQGRTSFSGSRSEWADFLSEEITKQKPDAIILFGSNRPAHVIARTVAAQFQIDVISLEEGYLRSGYIACEIGGNNQHSPMTDWRLGGAPCPLMSGPDVSAVATAPAIVGSSFKVMSFWGAVYYLARDFFSGRRDEGLFHRAREHPISLSWSWITHTTRRIVFKLRDRRVLRTLDQSDYILVPLQVASDSQLRNAARNWNTEALIEACIAAAAQSREDLRVVFKLHPLERNGPSLTRMIATKRTQLGVARDRVEVLSSGHMGDLARDASGMVVINSTSTFSALHHDTPVMVLGEAVYRHREIVTLGSTAHDVADFFTDRQAKPRADIDAFIADLKVRSLIPGDFYVSEGREIAIAGIIAKLERLQAVSRSHGEART